MKFKFCNFYQTNLYDFVGINVPLFLSKFIFFNSQLNAGVTEKMKFSFAAF